MSSSNAVNAPVQASSPIVEWVWYSGTDALKQGEGVCYNTDFGTATAVNARRGNYVERPSTTNNQAFAGVAARDYSAKSGGQFIEIYCPGSKGVPVAVGIDTTINTGIITCLAGAAGSHRGRFTFAGLPGRGSAVPRQTKTAVLERVVDGTGSLDTDGVTLTVSDSSDFTVGDTVVLLASEDEGSSKAVTPGKYLIESITDGTTIVLSTSAVGATPGSALTCSYYVYTGNPTVQADLLTGEESGLVEIVSPPNTGHATSDTFTVMNGGVSYINGGVTIATGNARAPLADGDYFGQKKGFYCLGTLTTNDAEIELDTAGKQSASEDTGDASGSGLLAMAALTFDAADELAFLEWLGIWQELTHNGGAIATS